MHRQIFFHQLDYHLARSWRCPAVSRVVEHAMTACLHLQDLAEVEMAVGQHVWPLQALGPPHGMLRSLRPFLFLDTSAIADSPLTQQLPVSCVLHHLYSRAPLQLQSPHERSGLAAAQVTHHSCQCCCKRLMIPTEHLANAMHVTYRSGRICFHHNVCSPKTQCIPRGGEERLK